MREPPSGPTVIGVDVARFGTDRTVICVRQGQSVIALDSYSHLDTMETAGRVVTAIREHEPDHVYIDEIGVGAGVVDRLREQGFKTVEGVNVGSCAIRRDHFDNLRQKFESGSIPIPNDAELIAQLSAHRYSITSSGQLRIEEKETLRRKGLPGPDKADALMLGFTESARSPYRVWGGPPAEITPLGADSPDDPSNRPTIAERRRLLARSRFN